MTSLLESLSLKLPSSSSSSSSSSLKSRVVTPTSDDMSSLSTNSINVNNDYKLKRWGFSTDENISGHGIRYQEVINYSRVSSTRGNHHCVMCGLNDVDIPSQNKDVCKTCDTSFWYFQKMDIVVKFCKGCKNFVCLSEFEDKPEASKCGRCRHRGRQNYFSKKKGALNKYCDDYNRIRDYGTPSPENDMNLGKRKRNLPHTPSPPISELNNHIHSNSVKKPISNGRPPAVPRIRRQSSLLSSPYCETSPIFPFDQDENSSPNEIESTLTKNGIASEIDTDFERYTPKNGTSTRSVTFGVLPSYRRRRKDSENSIESALSGIEIKQEINYSDPSLNPLLYLAITIGEVFGDGITSPLKVKVKKVYNNEDQENFVNRPSPLPINFHGSPDSSFEVSSNSDNDDREDYNDNGERIIQIVSDDEKDQIMM